LQGCSAKSGEGVWEGIGSLQEAMENIDKPHKTINETAR
jgi:hypothetical protein